MPATGEHEGREPLVCPVCRYDLEGSFPAREGSDAVTCPECGGRVTKAQAMIFRHLRTDGVRWWTGSGSKHDLLVALLLVLVVLAGIVLSLCVM